MGSTIRRSMIWLASVAVVVAVSGASAATINVGFESDAVGNVLTDFTSVDSSQVHLSDTIGEILLVL